MAISIEQVITPDGLTAALRQAPFFQQLNPCRCRSSPPQLDESHPSSGDGGGHRMENILLHAVTVFMGFFAIMNPIANVPIFLGLTSDDDKQTTATVALRSLMLAFLIVTIFSIAGKVIFDLFGITLPAFRITGGLIVFLIGFHMLQGNQSNVQHPSEDWG